jgi:hypothetical protein
MRAGIVSQSRFPMVRRKFTAELNQLRHEKDSPAGITIFNIINVLMGMRLLRIKVGCICDARD